MSVLTTPDEELSERQLQEVQLARLHDFTPHFDSHRGGSWCSFRKGEIRLWAQLGWVRAHLIDDTFRFHQKHQTLEDALLDRDGVPFGPDSRNKD